MVKMDTTKATIIPTASKMASAEVKWKPNLTSFSALAPNITGTAKKKVYSAATVRDTPMRMAPKMVAPLREVPGNSCNQLKSTNDQRRSISQLANGMDLGGFAFVQVSTTKKKIPKRMSIIATVCQL